MFQTLTTTYAAEIAPVAMRGYLTAWVSMCWGCGSFLSAGVLRGTLGLPGDWAWRVPYILQWIWPAPLFIVGIFCPESKSLRHHHPSRGWVPLTFQVHGTSSERSDMPKPKNHFEDSLGPVTTPRNA